ncbi:hypothetical protein [Frateuria sp. Soil773]|uniref:hypothetical protein n=1 Tax=Frateuria sp. Soil773 TaxID=1736407 RepID=UPI0012F8F6D3|nr:hypothetical protein [Frateuria sp. Soil773]
MKFETLMLQSFFGACLLVCLLTLGSMLAAHPAASSLAASHAPAAVVANPAG